MRKNFGSKPWMLPMPVLIVGTYDDNNVANAMNAAWGSVYNDDLFMLCLAKDRKTLKNIHINKAFTVSCATYDMLPSCDYVGIASGNSVPAKAERAGFTPEKSSFVNAPLFKELPFCMECELVRMDGEENVIARIVNISVDEAFLDEKGKPDVALINPILYETVGMNYHTFGPVASKAFFHKSIKRGG